MEEEKSSLYNHLKELDPAAAERITQNDTRRIVRALEVCLKSSTSMSEMQRELTRPLPYEFIKIGLTRNRKELYKLIEERIDRMISLGLVEEVRVVIKMIKDAETRRREETDGQEFTDSPFHRLTVSPIPAMQAIGYKEIAMYLDDQISFDEAVALVKRGTKRYAKRQFTWFKKEEGIHWIYLTGIYDNHEIFERVNEILNFLVAMDEKNDVLQY
jgi:tRNA dimethylallyltransferase